MDCALHKAGVTFVLDRAGVTGDDGASHNGMWDLSLLRVVPGLELAAPRDENQLTVALDRAVEISDRPTVIRFPKGALPEGLPAVGKIAAGDILVDVENPDVTIVAIGSMCHPAIKVAAELKSQGCTVRVIDPVWALPVNDALLQEIANDHLVVTLEDGLRAGGIGEGITAGLRHIESRAQVLNLGVPKKFLDHATRASVMKQIGLDVDGIVASIKRRLAQIVG
jgi:1-deoxy-D-xylulose-5-phosphate synthase